MLWVNSYNLCASQLTNNILKNAFVLCGLRGYIQLSLHWQHTTPAHGEAKAASKVTFTWVIVAEVWELARMDI